jgi:hypothetical protein
MTATTRARRMNASRLRSKLARVDERLQAGERHLRPFRRSLIRQLAAIDRKTRGDT